MDSKRYLNSKRTCERYGRGLVWLWRIRKNDPDFPKPIVINKHLLFVEDELDAYDESRRARA